MKELRVFRCSGCVKCIGETTCQNYFDISPPPYFDSAYVHERNSHIDEAEFFANKQGFDLKTDTGKGQWNFTYHQKMNELYRKGVRP